MTPDNPSIPESDIPNSEATESSEQNQSDQLPMEVKPDANQDLWSTENNTNAPESPPDIIEQLDMIAESEQELETDSELEAVVTNETSDEPKLFVDSWLDESATEQSIDISPAQVKTDNSLDQLEQQKAQLHQEIAELKAQKEQLLRQQLQELQSSLANMVEEGTKELKERKTALRIEIEKLERRKDRINQEMRSNFAGSSKELAIRVQGFKEYLVGSLQDLATAADKLELVKADNLSSRASEPERNRANPRRERTERDYPQGTLSPKDLLRNRERDGSRRRNDRSRTRDNSERGGATAQFSEATFADQSRRIRQLLDQYRNSPDYYGSPWKLRRTFEQNQAQKVQEWFFGQGGRGTVDSMGSRLQNILIASAAISILHNLYGDRCRVLVLTDTPENLGEWRRGLQDCLGISRNNFGANRGVTLFDAPEVLVQRAERLISEKLLPVIIIDETEELLNPSVLKFPVWMTFASRNKPTSNNYLY
ncbi:MAG: DUF3086 domain-containing protein [Cyanobacteria bacterium J06642_3]